MRSISWLFILTSVVFARVAFAADRVAVVDIPFSFEIQGKTFPASRYDVTLKNDRSFLTLSSTTNLSDTLSWTALPTGVEGNDLHLSIQFDRVGTKHELHAVRFGKYSTRILDTQFEPQKNREAAHSGQ